MESLPVDGREVEVEPAPSERSVPKFKYWKARGVSRTFGKANEEQLNRLETLKGAERLSKLAEYVLRECRIIRPEEESDSLLEAASEGSASTPKPEKTAVAIERQIESDRGSELMLELLPEAATLAKIYQLGQNYSKRQALLKATKEYNAIPPISRVDQLFRTSHIGPSDHRAVGDTIRIVVAHIEGKDLPEPPERLEIVE
jgi:hypothetical protein